MATREERLQSIAETIKDYRKGELDEPTPEHVDRWVKQFAKEVQHPILKEMDYVLKRTYLNNKTVGSFLGSLVTNEKLAGEDPCAFWRSANFLNIQGGGNSQREMLARFDKLLNKHCGFGTDDCGENAGIYIYIDDAIFTGNRVRTDLTKWVQETAPENAKINVITLAYHRGGQYYASQEIAKSAKAARKTIDFSWWRLVDLEDRKFRINDSDVLRPRSLGEDPLVIAYAKGLSHSPTLRTEDNVGEHKFFSSEQGRAVLEQEMLRAGVDIRKRCPYLNDKQRPLGNMLLQTLGFGSTLVTYRNCPNNAPLAFWAGNPWYPLFPRKTN